MGCKKCAHLLDEKVHLCVIEWWSVLLYLHVSVRTLQAKSQLLYAFLFTSHNKKISHNN